jgi:hypothetical protein
VGGGLLTRMRLAGISSAKRCWSRWSLVWITAVAGSLVGEQPLAHGQALLHSTQRTCRSSEQGSRRPRVGCQAAVDTPWITRRPSLRSEPEVMRSPTAVRSRSPAGRALSTDKRTGQTTDRRCTDANSVGRIP